MLAAVIEAAGGDVEGWRELTAPRLGRGDLSRLLRDVSTLRCRAPCDATEFTMGFAPYLLGGRTDENWDAFGTDIPGRLPAL